MTSFHCSVKTLLIAGGTLDENSQDSAVFAAAASLPGWEPFLQLLGYQSFIRQGQK